MTDEVPPLARDQYGALPWRYTRRRGLRLLLITSRTNRNWLIPKGWPMSGRSPAGAAAQEALEEAGAYGDVSGIPLGSYRCLKLRRDGDIWPVRVTVFPLEVQGTLIDWRESGQRERRWFSPQAAASAVIEPGLAQLLARLADSPELLVTKD